jgi:hypothetical protein
MSFLDLRSVQTYTATLSNLEKEENQAKFVVIDDADSTSQRIKAHREVATLKTSCGERKPRDLRGRVFNKRSTLATSAGVTLEKSVPFGKKSLMRPFVFSLSPRSQAWYGVAKKIFASRAEAMS